MFNELSCVSILISCVINFLVFIDIMDQDRRSFKRSRNDEPEQLCRDYEKGTCFRGDRLEDFVCNGFYFDTNHQGANLNILRKRKKGFLKFRSAKISGRVCASIASAFMCMLLLCLRRNI